MKLWWGIIGAAVLAAACWQDPQSQLLSGPSVGGEESIEIRDEAMSPEVSGDGDVVKLRKKNRAAFWEGTVHMDDPPHPGAPPECAGLPCDHIRLEIDLPRGTFSDSNRPGGVQVALRWFGDSGPHQLPPDIPGCCGEFDTLHLWIYKDDELRGASPGIIAVSQSAFIPEPENGWYDVWIAYDPTYNVNPSVDYEALAEVEYLPKIDPVRRVLPDLEFRGAERITFDTPSFPYFEPDPPPGSSCFLSEMEEDGARNCLRYDQVIANTGRGPIELWFSVPSDQPVEADQVFPVSQRVHSSDGASEDRDAGHVEFHGVHGHFHYSSFAASELWESNASGEKLGSAPVRGGKKVSFCVADIRIDTWGKKGDGPRTYYAPECLFPAISEEGLDRYKQGITAGWSDVYDWYIPDQYIEVTGVLDGFYRLEFCADPERSIEESDEDNNCVINHILLTNMGTPQQGAMFLGVIEERRGGDGHAIESPADPITDTLAGRSRKR